MAIPDDQLRWQNAKRVGRPAVAIPYSDVDGTTLYRRYRIRLHAPDHYRSPKGSKAAPYSLNHLARHGQTVLVEGETDAATVWYTGFPSLGIPGAGNWREAWKVHLQDIEAYIWREPDEGGDALVSRSPRTCRTSAAGLLAPGAWAPSQALRHSL